MSTPGGVGGLRREPHPTRLTDMTHPPAPPGFRTQAYTILNALQALIDHAGKPDTLKVGRRPTRIVTQHYNTN